MPCVLSSEHVEVKLNPAGEMPRIGKYVVIAKAYIALPKIETNSAGSLVIPAERLLSQSNVGSLPRVCCSNSHSRAISLKWIRSWLRR